jgi:hypothetical protein
MGTNILRLSYLPGQNDLTANIYAADGTGGPLNPSPAPFVEMNRVYVSSMETAVADSTYRIDILRGGNVIGQLLGDLTAEGTTVDLCDGPTVRQIVQAIGDGVTLKQYIVVPPEVAVAAQDPTVITCVRGDTLLRALPPMGDLTGWTKLVLTAKANITDADGQAVFQVVAGSGLSVLNGAAAADPSCSLTVTNVSEGTADLELNAAVTAQFAIGALVWDCQATLPARIISPISGCFNITPDVTQSVT